MAKRRYFTKAVAPVAPPEPSPAWRQPVQGIAPDGRSRVYDPAWVRMMLGRAKGGKAAHAAGKAPQFDSQSGRKAAQKRWKTRNRKVKGIRLGLRTPAPAVDRAALRACYVHPRQDCRVRYDPAGQQWYLRDAHGERPCTERTALRYVGAHTRPTRMGTLPRRFAGIDLEREGWNPDHQ